MPNQGEWVTLSDFNGIVTGLGANNAISYWKDFNSDGLVDFTDLGIVTAHLNHNCTAPRDP